MAREGKSAVAGHGVLIGLVSLIALSLVIGLWSVWPARHTAWFNDVHAQTETTVMAMHGQFGDTFGSLNALFTGLAFVGVLGTLLLQIWAQVQQTKEFAHSQDLSAATAQLSALETLLSRVESRLEKTEGSTNELELKQRQEWMKEREKYVDEIMTISFALGLVLPKRFARS